MTSLINHVSGEWDIEFLKLFISPVEYEAILATHLGDPELKDKLIWPFEGDLFCQDGLPLGALSGDPID